MSFVLTQSWNVSVISNINNTTLWGPQLYTASGTGVCLGVGVSYSVTPSFIPVQATGTTNYTFQALVTSYSITWILGKPIPTILQSYSAPIYPPITWCSCMSTTCYNLGCTCCAGSPGPPPGEGTCQGYGGLAGQWIWNQQSCSWQCQATSPIVLDVDGGGFHMNGVENGVLFDFFGTGHPLQISWTAPGSTNAWLVLDRNGNRVIDKGSEMFGNLTPQPPCLLGRNGFNALAQYDANGYGVIDARDPIYAQLRLWIDRNHDGVSQPGELYTLPQLGVSSISVQYAPAPWVDALGNHFRFRAKVTGTNPTLTPVAFDVFLTTQ